MDFRQIEAFVKVVELGGFSKAADALHISQPSISTYITALESELNTVLLNRSTKSMSLTLAGERFLEKALAMLALKEESIQTLTHLAEDASGDIRVLASSVPALYLLPGIIADFHRLYLGISFTMHQADSAEVVRGIAGQKADIGFAGSLIPNSKCDFYSIAHESLVCVAPDGGAYTEDKVYTLEELLYTGCFISREQGSGTRTEYEKYFVEHGILLDKITACASMDNTSSIINAVINGLGVSIVSELAARPFIAQKYLRQIRLQYDLPERIIYVVLHRSITHSHLVNLFMDYLQQLHTRANK